MTQEWKTGDQAYLPVKIISVKRDLDGEIRVAGACVDPDAGTYVDPDKLIRAIPVPSPLTELDRAVVEAAMMWRAVWRAELDRPGGSPATQDLVKAVDAILAARQPVDPVKELVAAVREYLDPDDLDASARVRDALTAFEARAEKEGGL